MALVFSVLFVFLNGGARTCEIISMGTDEEGSEELELERQKDKERKRWTLAEAAC